MLRGKIVAEVPPHWVVLRRVGCKKRDPEGYVVVDIAPMRKGEVPLRVFGPDTKDACIAWAKEFALTYLTLKGVYDSE
jgi:hypothetical protein